MRPLILSVGFAVTLASAGSAGAQVDEERASAYFAEAETLCNRDAGQLWGVSLCGPMVFADAATRTLATNEPKPEDPWPRALGYANSAFAWGGKRWSTYVWSFVPAEDATARRRLLMHELFHRVQPDLTLLAFGSGETDHLDTLEGRYWLQLEWRALAAALAAEGAEQRTALADALTFRMARRALFSDSATSTENADEIREGLAQYTGIVLTSADHAGAARAAIEQLEGAPQQPTFVRSFAPASGTAYGVLLDAYSPDWRRRVTSSTDLGTLLAAAANVAAATDSSGAAQRYDATGLRASESERELERQARVAALTKRFIDGPVAIFPRPRSASLITTGSMPIPGAGTVFFQYHASDAWGSIDVEGGVLLRDEVLVVPAPATVGAERSFAGNGWRATLADGWVVQPGERSGDYVVVEDTK